MATIIDELVVKLGLDGSTFKAQADKTQADISRVNRGAVAAGKGLEESLGRSQQATQRGLKQGTEVGRQASLQFSKFRTEVAALFTILATGGGLQKFIRDVANTEANTGRLAKNIGMSTSELNAWQEAAIRNGGTADATGQSLLGLTNEFQNLAMGKGSAALPFFRNLGIAISDANGDMRPMSDILLDLSDKFKNMSPQRANAFGAALGLDQGTITLLRQGREAVKAYLAEAKRIGVISDADAAAGIKFQQNLANFEQAIRNLGRAIGNDLMPIFESYMTEVTDWLSDPKNKEFVAKEVHDDIKRFADGVKYVIAMIKEWHGVAEALAIFIGGRWLLAMTVGLGPVGIAVAAIAASFIAIKKGMEDISPSSLAADSPLWHGISEDEQLKYPNSPESRKRAGKEGENPNPFHWWNPGSWANRPSGGIASTDMDNVQRGFLDTLAGPESGGHYDIKNGGSSFDDFSKFPEGIGPGGTSSAAGRYQITKGTWDELQKKYPGVLGDFSPKNQDAAAWLLARDRYSTETNGGDLEDDLRSGKTAKVASALKNTWPSLPGGSQSGQTQQNFDNAIRRNTADQLTPSEGFQNNVVNPVKDFFKKNFGGPDPSVQKWTAPSSSKQSSSNGQTGSIDNSVDVHIANMTVTGANSDEVAKNIGSSLKKYVYVAQANSGLE